MKKIKLNKLCKVSELLVLYGNINRFRLSKIPRGIRVIGVDYIKSFGELVKTVSIISSYKKIQYNRSRLYHPVKKYARVGHILR